MMRSRPQGIAASEAPLSRTDGATLPHLQCITHIRYTREAGVRNLSRALAAVCRHVAVNIVNAAGGGLVSSSGSSGSEHPSNPQSGPASGGDSANTAPSLIRQASAQTRLSSGAAIYSTSSANADASPGSSPVFLATSASNSKKRWPYPKWKKSLVSNLLQSAALVASDPSRPAASEGSGSLQGTLLAVPSGSVAEEPEQPGLPYCPESFECGSHQQVSR